MAVNGNKDGNGFDKNPQNINRKGQPQKVSIKGEIEKLLQSDGTVIYSGDQIVEIGEKDGEKFVKIKVPTQEALANKMVKIAMGKEDRVNTLRALTQLLEQFDGRARQAMDVKIEQTDTLPLFPDVIIDEVSEDDSDK